MAEARGGRVRSESARRAILDATWSLLGEQGFDGLTIEGVAAAAGVGKQTIYRWWPSKAALVAECVVDSGSMLAGDDPLPDTGDLAADLAAWLRQVSQPLQDDRAAALLRGLIAAAAESPLIADQLYASVTSAAETQLAHRIAADRSPIDDEARAAASALLGAFVYSILVNRPLGPATADSIGRIIARGVSDAAR